MVLVIVIHRVNLLNIRQIQKQKHHQPRLAKPSQPRLDPDGSQPPEPPQPLLPTLQREVLIPPISLSNFENLLI